MNNLSNYGDPRSGGRVFCGKTGVELDPRTLQPLDAPAAPEPIAPPPPPEPIAEPAPPIESIPEEEDAP